MKYCYECGEAMEIDSNGIANHVDEDGNIDHERDADHVAVDDEEVSE